MLLAEHLARILAAMKKGFTNGKKCAAKGSSDITADAIPDACAKATVGRFRPTAAGAGTGNLPVCTPTCPNIFDQIRNIDITGLQEKLTTALEWATRQGAVQLQDSSAVGASIVKKRLRRSCSNTQLRLRRPPGCRNQIFILNIRKSYRVHGLRVYCTKPLKALAGNEGIRRCTMKGPLAEFEPAPDCVQPCATPDHYEGTLDVSKCKNDCVPGDEELRLQVRGLLRPWQCARRWRPRRRQTMLRHIARTVVSEATGLQTQMRRARQPVRLPECAMTSLRRRGGLQLRSELLHKSQLFWGAGGSEDVQIHPREGGFSSRVDLGGSGWTWTGWCASVLTSDANPGTRCQDAAGCVLRSLGREGNGLFLI
eukprot:s3781_g5.t1